MEAVNCDKFFPIWKSDLIVVQIFFLDFVVRRCCFVEKEECLKKTFGKHPKEKIPVSVLTAWTAAATAATAAAAVAGLTRTTV